MEEYTFTDLRIGDNVLIRAGKLRGHFGIIKSITAQGFLLETDTGEMEYINHASMMEKL